MNPRNRKRVVVGLASVCVVAVAAGAYAYFTTTGSGTATATVGHQLRRDPERDGDREPLPGLVLAGDADRRQPLLRANSGSARSRWKKSPPDAGHPSCSVVISGGNPDFTMADVVVNKIYGPGNGQAVTPAGR